MTELVYEARTSNEGAYANSPAWINPPPLSPDVKLLNELSWQVPPGPYYGQHNISGYGSGLSKSDELPVIQFARKPTESASIDVFFFARGTWLVSDRAKDVLQRIDPNALEFLDTKTQTAKGVEVHHYWICDVVQFRDAVDFDGPDINLKMLAPDRPFLSFLGSRKTRFKSKVLDGSRLWRNQQLSNPILCTESACRIWSDVRPKLRGIRWERIGVTDGAEE